MTYYFVKAPIGGKFIVTQSRDEVYNFMVENNHKKKTIVVKIITYNGFKLMKQEDVMNLYLYNVDKYFAISEILVKRFDNRVKFIRKNKLYKHYAYWLRQKNRVINTETQGDEN
jgi:hypothetical protein